VHQNIKQFTGSWAIILGGSSGFGFAAVEKLALHGMNIAVLYREKAAEDRAVKKKFSQLAEANDVTISPYNINALDGAARTKFIEQFSADKKNKVKLLLHSIARGNLKPLVSANDDGALTLDDIQLTTYAMATSMFDWAKALIAADLFNADGRIIGLTSEGSYKYWEGYAAVSIAKASLESLTTYMAVELTKYGLKTNLVQAGITATPSLKKIPESEKLIQTAIKRNPLGRITEPKDVANVIYLLCTAEAAWINGTIIQVDGGEHCR
jgi:enoyl-[acyl-carrier protein] reductase III